jgi:hypothetical protein
MRPYLFGGQAYAVQPLLIGQVRSGMRRVVPPAPAWQTRRRMDRITKESPVILTNSQKAVLSWGERAALGFSCLSPHQNGTTGSRTSAQANKNEGLYDNQVFVCTAAGLSNETQAACASPRI